MCIIIDDIINVKILIESKINWLQYYR